MTSPTRWSHTATPDDLADETERLAIFDIHVEFVGLGYLKEEDFEPVAHFGPRKEDGGWWVRISPAAPINDQWSALDRIWLAVTHPKSHPMWDNDFVYGKHSIYFGAHLVRDRHNFAEYLMKQVEQVLRTELSKSSPSMLSHWAKSDDDIFTRQIHHGQIDEYADVIAGNVRAEMARQERSVAELGDVLNLTTTTVRKSVKGTRSWRRDELKRVADWLDLDVDDLVTVPYMTGGDQ